MEVKLSHKKWEKLPADMPIEKIIKKIGVGELKAICMRKKRAGWKFAYYIWWETKDKWFCNIAREHETKWGWTIAKDLPHHLDHNRRQNYEFYVQGKKE